MKLVLLFKIILGFLALILAAVGLFLPVWPTTPFVLMAIACFSSTPKLRGWMLRCSFFREYYESYTAGTGLQRKTVVRSLSFLWVMLILSMVVVGRWFVTLLLLAVGVAVTIHILYISKARGGKV